MLISCEKCSTTYVLDDALIPPQGAPVQCTRCGHVFTARLAAAEPAPLPPRAAAAPGNSTMMFGTPPPPPPKNNTTMMFGTPGSNAAPPPPPPPAKNTTMMFGTPGANAAPPPAAPPPPNPRNTMMFGTPASNAAPVPPLAAPPPNPKATMVFGAPPAAPPPPAKNTTMMFGTPASNAVTIIPPAPPPPSSKQTMVFGAPAAPPSPKHTMVFGTAASNAAASQPPAPPPAASASKTMVFGGQAPPSVKNTTMMFGTPASNAVSEPAEETLMDNQSGQSSRTVLFGQLPPTAAAEAPPPAKNQTMMFGRPSAIPKISAGVVELAGMSANEGAPNESTVRVDAAQVLEEHGEMEPAPEIPRHDRTQRFAMSSTGLSGPTPPEGQSAVQDRHNRTQLFAMTTSPEPVPEPSLDDGPSSVFVGETTLPPGAMPMLDHARSGGTDLNTTLPPDGGMQLDPPGVSLLHDPANMTPPEAVPAADGPVATTLPNLPVLKERAMAPLALELPPEPMGSPEELRSSAQNQQQLANEDAAALRAARGGGAGRAVVVILIIVALALTGVLIYRLFGKQLLGSVLGNAVPVEALQATEQALATLRLDDQGAQEKAVAQLTSVIAQHPGLAEPQAALVIATALRFDDVQGQLTRATVTLRSLKSQEGSPARIVELETAITANEGTARELKTQLQGSMEKLSTLAVETGTSAHLAVIRADGLARGVLGDAEALTRTVAFKQGTKTPDDWVDLIEPEYALNGGSSLDEAIEQLIALKARGTNSTFLRPYVLLARLQLKKGEPQAARHELEQVATMNQNHEIARELLGSIAK